MWFGVVVPSFAVQYSIRAQATAACDAAVTAGSGVACYEQSGYGYCLASTWQSCWIYGNKVSEYLYGDCPIGQVAGAGGLCVPWCEIDHSIPATDVQCSVACPTGYKRVGTMCEKDCSGATTMGDAGFVANVTACQSTQIEDGCEYTGGDCICASGGGSTQCFQWGPFVPTGNGVSIDYVNDPTAPPPSDTVTQTQTGAPPPPNGSGSCPSGYYFESPTGVCRSPDVAGTPATSTSPAVAAIPGKITCPVGSTLYGTSCVYGVPLPLECPTGFIKNAAGLCENIADMTDAVSKGTCPAGFSKLGDLCISNTSGTGSCPEGFTRDAAGKCVGSQGTSETGDLISYLKSLFEGLSSSLSTATQDQSKMDRELTFNEKLLGVTEQTIEHGWTWGLDLQLSGSCQPWAISGGSWTLDMDPCPTAARIREIGSYVFYVLTMFGLLNILVGRQGGGHA